VHPAKHGKSVNSSFVVCSSVAFSQRESFYASGSEYFFNDAFTQNQFDSFFQGSPHLILDANHHVSDDDLARARDITAMVPWECRLLRGEAAIQYQGNNNARVPFKAVIDKYQAKRTSIFEELLRDFTRQIPSPAGQEAVRNATMWMRAGFLKAQGETIIPHILIDKRLMYMGATPQSAYILRNHAIGIRLHCALLVG
jgi:hypothetical protein